MFRPIQIIRPNSQLLEHLTKDPRFETQSGPQLFLPSLIRYPLHLVQCKPLELTVNSCQGKEPGDVDLPKSNTI